MNCNYLKDNSREIEDKKNDFMYTALCGSEDIPVFSCETGTSRYAPTEEDRKDYCTLDFLHCPRLYLKLYKK